MSSARDLEGPGPRVSTHTHARSVSRVCVSARRRAEVLEAGRQAGKGKRKTAAGSARALLKH